MQICWTICIETGEIRTSWPQPRYPSWHAPPVLLIRLPKLPRERGLFIGQNKYMSYQKHHSGINHEMHAAKDGGLPENRQGHAEIHRIANVPMQGRGDQIFRRRNRRRSTQPANRKLPCATKVDCGSAQENDTAQPCQRSIFRPEKPAQQPARNENRNRTRHDDRKQNRIQNRSNSACHESHLGRRHPERSRFSGGAKDLARSDASGPSIRHKNSL